MVFIKFFVTLQSELEWFTQRGLAWMQTHVYRFHSTYNQNMRINAMMGDTL